MDIGSLSLPQFLEIRSNLIGAGVAHMEQLSNELVVLSGVLLVAFYMEIAVITHHS